MTTLRAYLDKTGEKQSEFADRVQTTPATISRLCAGNLKPSLDLAHAIEVATRGEVRTEVWIARTPSAPAEAIVGLIVVAKEGEKHATLNAAAEHLPSTGQISDASTADEEARS
ncbi:hypothetical protein [uncultured Novosphingobium sp.]|uniref:hypothetical protein n=1 Tax=uncultured Novosphingobium sp. TaxID=292277 RepID=UPI003749D0F0